MDPTLALYYMPLRLIVSGPLLSLERLRTIVRFNLGAYDHHRDDYERRTRAGPAALDAEVSSDRGDAKRSGGARHPGYA